MLLSACEKIGLRVGAMIRKRANSDMALMMDIRWPRENPLYLGDIIGAKEVGFESIRLARKYYGMIYNHKSIHYKEPEKVVEKPVMVVKKTEQPKPPGLFKF